MSSAEYTFWEFQRRPLFGWTDPILRLHEAICVALFPLSEKLAVTLDCRQADAKPYRDGLVTEIRRCFPVEDALLAPQPVPLTAGSEVAGSRDEQAESQDRNLGRQPFAEIVGDVLAPMHEVAAWLVDVTETLAARYLPTPHALTRQLAQPVSDHESEGWMHLFPPEETTDPYGGVTYTWSGEYVMRDALAEPRTTLRGHLMRITLSPRPTNRVRVTITRWVAADPLRRVDEVVFLYLIEELTPQIKALPGFTPYQADPDAIVGSDGMMHIADQADVLKQAQPSKGAGEPDAVRLPTVQGAPGVTQFEPIVNAVAKAKFVEDIVMTITKLVEQHPNTLPKKSLVAEALGMSESKFSEQVKLYGLVWRQLQRAGGWLRIK